MNTLYINFIADKLGVKPWRVENCIQLLEEGATVPFISRYRKEATGTMTDVEVAETNFHYQKFLELDKRKEAVGGSIEEQGKMTPELKALIEDGALEEDAFPSGRGHPERGGEVCQGRGCRCG